jgi:hypothetical protein
MDVHGPKLACTLLRIATGVEHPGRAWNAEVAFNERSIDDQLRLLITHLMGKPTLDLLALARISQRSRKIKNGDKPRITRITRMRI